MSSFNIFFKVEIKLAQLRTTKGFINLLSLTKQIL